MIVISSYHCLQHQQIEKNCGKVNTTQNITHKQHKQHKHTTQHNKTRDAHVHVHVHVQSATMKMKPVRLVLSLVSVCFVVTNQFGFGPQLNFGFPVSKFAAPADDTMKKIQVAANKPDSSYWPMTSRIWPFIVTQGTTIAEAAINAERIQWKDVKQDNTRQHISNTE